MKFCERCFFSFSLRPSKRISSWTWPSLSQDFSYEEFDVPVNIKKWRSQYLIPAAVPSQRGCQNLPSRFRVPWWACKKPKNCSRAKKQRTQTVGSWFQQPYNNREVTSWITLTTWSLWVWYLKWIVGKGQLAPEGSESNTNVEKFLRLLKQTFFATLGTRNSAIAILFDPTNLEVVLISWKCWTGPSDCVAIFVSP